MLIIIVIILLILLSIEAYIALRKKLSTTPYDISKQIKRRFWVEPRDKEYDFFISYESQDASRSREICESLIANGCKVWFDEYIILLTKRKIVEHVEPAIEAGITESMFGICLTNLGYAESRSCRKELKLMLKEENCSPNNIIEIKSSSETWPSYTFPELYQSFSFEYKNLKETLSSIQKATGIQLRFDKNHVIEEPPKHTFFIHGVHFSLQLSVWTFSQNLSLYKKSRNSYDLRLYRKEKQTKLWGHLSIQERPVSIRRFTTSRDSQKKHLLDLIKEARNMYGPGSNKVCYGVHLIHLGNFGHGAFTIYNDPGIWSRKYNIELPLLNNDKDIEFNFEFFSRGHFREFCRAAADFNKLVLSLECQACFVNENLFKRQNCAE